MGVWLLVALIAAAYVALHRRDRSTEGDGGDSRPRVAYFAAGLFFLWGALDWPLGLLGASYLASVHVIQFLLAGVIAPGLMLLGIPRGAFAAIERRPTLHAFLGDLTVTDRLLLETTEASFWLQVTDIQVVNSAEAELNLWTADRLLTLVTCYPLDAQVPGGPLRLVVTAEPMPALAML
ncbi:MAG: cytochrome c oxidase assembly protein [Proteobacteria bacterium]|nr:cytochrome c oxidase assembly protein [Pseudomonadota bacterium]